MKRFLVLPVLLALAVASFASITVSSPANGAKVTSPVKFVASAASAHPIMSMAIYVDSKEVYSNYSTSMNTSIAIASGQHAIVVKAWNSEGTIYSDSMTVQVTGTAAGPSPMSITTPSLPGATDATAYSATQTAIGGTPPYTWSISSGSLPAGLSLSSAGVISGTTSVAGTSNFSVTVKDSSSSPQAATEAQTIAVSSQSATILTSTLVISSADNGKTYSNYKVSTTSGPCVTITGAANVTLENFNIGPCGTNNTTSASNGVEISSSSSINIFDSYIHVQNAASGCCDTHDGVLVTGSSSNVTLQGNVIAYNESNIEVQGGGNSTINVIGNYLLNPTGPFPRGQNFQSWGSSDSSYISSVTVSDNYAFSCVIGGASGAVTCPTGGPAYLYSEHQEDSINFGFTTAVTAKGNWVWGGHSASGCGIIADEDANSVQFLNNNLYNTGQGGVCIASGTNQTVSGNNALGTGISGGGNQGVTVWNQYSEACGPVTVSGNKAEWVQSPIPCNPSTGTCSVSGFWSGGGCGTVTTTSNTFDEGSYSAPGGPAYQALNPMTSKNPAPLIPPQPKNCVAASPYSTQTSAPACN